MIKSIKDYKFTTVLLVISIVILFLTLSGRIEVFEYIVEFFEMLEAYEVDEWFLVTFLLALGLAIDFRLILLKRRTTSIIKDKEIAVLKATMNNVLDIVNNYLNQIQLLGIEAEENGKVSKQNIQLIETLTFETSKRLKKLANLEEIVIDKTISGLPLLSIDKDNE
ncbi:MAG: hypothetical protein MJE63_20650 [Proteobacteria bacterium]|nr:hypothetical protein [Pseudomonadota bacterium]